MILSLAKRNLLIAGGLLIALWLFYYAASLHSQRVNVDATAYDQNGYLFYGRLLHDTQLAYLGDRNRMPAYPFLLSLIYQPHWSEEQFFQHAKTFNILLSMALLIWIFYLLKKRLSLHAAVNVWIMTAFTVFVFKAGYVQAEILFYFINFLLFLALWRMLVKPQWQTALVAGALAGLGQLTKASVLPELLAFVTLAFFQMAYETRTSGRAAFPWRKAAQTVTVVVCFLLIVFPYLRNSKKIFGQYFYNVNSTFYFWCDSVEEWKTGPKAHGDRFGWPKLSAEEIPSAKNYFHKYGIDHLRVRLLTGGHTLFTACRRSFGFFKYLVVYILLAAGTILLQRAQAASLWKRRAFLILFVFSLAAGYGVLMAWWNYLGPQVRHILALFLPFMFSAFVWLERMPWPTLTVGRLQIHGLRLLHVATSLLLAWDVYAIVTTRILAMEAGL
jgi:hypothetical protein